MALSTTASRILIWTGLSLLVLVTNGAAQGQQKDPEWIKNPTGLSIPRYVSLGAREANIRMGPGSDYPVAWIFQRKGMPLEITAEFDTWRRIRDADGDEGWIHQAMLSGKRSAVIIGETRTLYTQRSTSTGAVAQAEAGVVGELVQCNGSWCEIDVGRYRGWIQKQHIWGAYPDEDFRD